MPAQRLKRFMFAIIIITLRPFVIPYTLRSARQSPLLELISLSLSLSACPRPINFLENQHKHTYLLPLLRRNISCKVNYVDT